MQRILMLSASIVGILWATNGVADSPQLKGTYGFTRTVKCVVSVYGFDPSDFHALGPSFGEAFAEEGIRTFNGDGTGTQSTTTLGIIEPALTPCASSSHFNNSFTYIINGDGSWRIPGEVRSTERLTWVPALVKRSRSPTSRQPGRS